MREGRTLELSEENKSLVSFLKKIFPCRASLARDDEHLKKNLHFV